jgi:peptide/nickel transport system permease protein
MSGSVTLEQAARIEIRGRRLPAVLEWTWRFMRRKPLGFIGAVIIVLLALLAITAPLSAPSTPTEIHAADRLQGPSPRYLMGTDNLGRDIFSQIVWGARISMYVGFAAVLLSITAATLIGVVSGYFGGRLDATMQRLVDAVIALPGIFLILTIMAILGPGMNNVIFALAVGGAASNSRVIRSATLALKEMTYVEAARVVGSSHLRIIFVHLLPNVMPAAITLATLGLGAAILAEASLSFLGLGVPPPNPSWGSMLSGAGRRFMLQAPWMAFFPGLFLSLAVFGFNMLGDALRDLLDPRLRGFR